jgi:hypothetical protein
MTPNAIKDGPAELLGLHAASRMGEDMAFV